MEESLIKILQSTFTVDEKSANSLAAGLHDAFAAHKIDDNDKSKGNDNEMYVPRLGLKKYRMEMVRALNGIKKLELALKNIGPVECHKLDTRYYEANNRDTMLMLLMGQNYNDEGKSGIELVTARIKKAIEQDTKHIPSPGQGSARMEGMEYTRALEILGRFFTETCPKHPVSPSPHSKFYRYVEIWWNRFFGSQEMPDMRRQISNMINTNGVRLQQS